MSRHNGIVSDAVRGLLAAILGMALADASSAADREHELLRESLTTVEGVVAALETLAGEGDVRVEVVHLALDAPEDGVPTIAVALAPAEALEQIGFVVRVGDRIRVKVFVADERPLVAHKVSNLTRSTMVRLRSLTRIPLWDTAGRWQGGPPRMHRGGGRGGAGRRR